MTINEMNILKRWEIMANADLGSLVQPVAEELKNFFSYVIENNYKNNISETILKLLRGFEINTQIDAEDCHLVDCYDVNTVQMSKYGVEEFDWYLMNDLGWNDRYQYALGLKKER